MKEIGRIKDRYDFSLDSRQLGLVLFGAFVFLVLVFVLGMSVGKQWESKKQSERQPIAQAAPPAVPATPATQAAPPFPAAPAAPAASAPALAPVPAPIATPVAPPAAPPAIPPASPPVQASAATRSITATPTRPAQARASDSLTFPKVLASSSRNTTPLMPEKKKVSGQSEAAGKYTLQVGAYKDRKDAQTRADRLCTKGYDARVTAVKEKSGATLYKVRVGNFDTKDKARAAAGRLKSAEGLVPYVTLDK